MRRIGKVFLLGVVVGLVIAALRALRDGGRPPSTPALAPAPPALPDPVAPRPAAAVAVEPPPSPHPEVGPEAGGEVEPVAGDGVEPQGKAPVATTSVGPVATTWVAPVDGECPEGFPIKVKVRSGIFHQPGGLSYARTRPDRCYPTAAAAEADGYRPALR